MKPQHQFKVGDVFENQCARLKVVELFFNGDKPAYKVISPFTKGEPWNMDEYWLLTSKKVKERKGEFSGWEASV